MSLYFDRPFELLFLQLFDKDALGEGSASSSYLLQLKHDLDEILSQSMKLDSANQKIQGKTLFAAYCCFLLKLWSPVAKDILCALLLQ